MLIADFRNLVRQVYEYPDSGRHCPLFPCYNYGVNAATEQSLNDMLREILTSRVYEVAKESSLDFAPLLSKRFNNSVWLKREDQQPVFSFKLRGAYNKIAKLSEAERKRGVITASAGNHAQGVFGCKETEPARLSL